MGAWGHGIFENDSVLDWKYDLLETKDLTLIEEVFREIMDAEYIESDLASICLGAAEIIAALHGKPGSEIRSESSYVEDLIVWINTFSGQGKGSIEKAKEAVTKVKEDSELKELWEESEDFQDWLKMVTDLEIRLRD